MPHTIEMAQFAQIGGVNNWMTSMFSIDLSDSIYQSFRSKTTMGLEIGSLVAGGYGAVKGAIAFYKLAKMPMQISKIANKTRNAGLLKAENIIEKLEGFLGKNSRVFKNSHGDLLIESEDGLRQFRMDLNHPAPHKNPHTHLVEYEMRKNRKFETTNERIYPTDVSPE